MKPSVLLGDAMRQKVFFSTKTPAGIQYEQLLCLKEQKKRVVIDVRDRYEVENTGQIPGSINVPLKEVEYALEHLDDEQFEKQYGAAKPGKRDGIVFYCKTTARSKEAAKRASAVGYSKVNFYIGGYTDWTTRNP